MRHEVKVVRIGPVSYHPDADTLGITEIDGYTVLVRRDEPKMNYGVAPGSRGFRAFDVYDTDKGEFLGYEDFVHYFAFSRAAPVPELYVGPLSGCDPKIMAEGKSTLADHIREGVVIKPVVERYDRRVGRIALKCVGNGYLEKS